MRRFAALAIIGVAVLSSSGCARLAEALFAPQQVAANTAQSLAARSGASDDANSLGNELDRLLAGRPENAAELQRLHSELARRAAEEQARAGGAQDSPARRSPWHPRTVPVSAPADHLALGPAWLPPVRGMHAAVAPLPDGVPTADPPYGFDLAPVGFDMVPGGQTPPDSLLLNQ